MDYLVGPKSNDEAFFFFYETKEKTHTHTKEKVI